MERHEHRIERLQFIERHIAGEETVAELCRRSGISRKTGYKIIGRYEAYGENGLLDRSRAPHSHPNATPIEVAERIIEAKRIHPTWGPKKIVAWLHSIDPYVPWPSSSTAGAILDRVGLVRRRKRRRRATRWGEPFAHARHPNDVWAIDLKGWFRTDDGMRIDPLTAQDAMSRYLLVCDPLDRPAGPEVKRSLERTFREYGIPRAIRTDNGPPFASVGLGSLSPLSAWWVKLGSYPNASSPVTPNRMDASSAFTEPSRPRPLRLQRPTGDDNGEPSNASDTPTTSRGHMRPWVSNHQAGCTRPRSDPIPRVSARPSTTQVSPYVVSAATGRSNGREICST